MNKVDLAHLIMANSYLDTQEADNLADKILSAGFIHKDDVEIDKDKLWGIIAKMLAGKTTEIELAKHITDTLVQDKSWIK